MNEITKLLDHWLASNNIQREGMRLILEFPDAGSFGRAHASIKREDGPMNGLGLAMRVRDIPC